jgi:hypothetical protein
MEDRERRLLEALKVLVDQIETSNAMDDHGHWLINNQAFREARALVAEIEGSAITPLPSPPSRTKWLAYLLEMLIPGEPDPPLKEPRQQLRIVDPD